MEMVPVGEPDGGVQTEHKWGNLSRLKANITARILSLHIWQHKPAGRSAVVTEGTCHKYSLKRSCSHALGLNIPTCSHAARDRKKGIKPGLHDYGTKKSGGQHLEEPRISTCSGGLVETGKLHL